jgi:hypothetical protein
MMPRIKIEKGARYGMLTATRPYGVMGNGKRAWQCRCDCGRSVRVTASALHGGKSKSCGCGKVKRFTESKFVHGMTDTPTYITWACMIQRCANPKVISYKDYGAKGVTVCERWKTFTNFFADMGERPEEKTLDRINPFGNYEQGNCRWATKKEQSNNTRGHAAIRLLAQLAAK